MTRRGLSEGSVDRGLTVGAMLLAGLVLGALTTILHRGRVDLGFGSLWLGIAVGVLALTCLAAGIRLTLRERGPVIAFAAGVTISLVALAAWSAGRSIIVMPDLVGIVWMIAAPAVVWLAAVWPALPGERSRAVPGQAEPIAVDAPDGAPRGATVREYAGDPATDPEEPQP